MREKIKEMIASFVYALYEKGVLKERVQVCSIDETIDALLDTDNSLVRFGDGEITLIAGIASATQQGNSELAQRLIQVLQSNEDKLLIAIVDSFRGMKYMRKENRIFWKKHLLKFRKYYNKYCKADRVYYNAFMSRCYLPLEKREECKEKFQKIKRIWKDKRVVIVEGEQTHNGVGNDLFLEAAEIKRILCPSKNAYSYYEQILNECMKFDTDYMFLLSIGGAAKPLTYDLFKQGYRAIDIGNLDLEYEWFLMQAQKKTAIKKHQVIGMEANKKAGYNEYIEQIFSVVQGDKAC